MKIRYICRYCHTLLGELNEELTEAQLGFGSLTPEERLDIIQVNDKDQLLVKVTCEICQETLESQPELAVYNAVIQ